MKQGKLTLARRTPYVAVVRKDGSRQRRRQGRPANPRVEHRALTCCGIGDPTRFLFAILGDNVMVGERLMSKWIDSPSSGQPRRKLIMASWPSCTASIAGT